MAGQITATWKDAKTLEIIIKPEAQPSISKTGKSLILASTAGFVDAGQGAKLNLNLIKGNK